MQLRYIRARYQEYWSEKQWRLELTLGRNFLEDQNVGSPSVCLERHYSPSFY